MREMLFREALNEALREEMKKDPLVFLLGFGIGERGGPFKVTEGLFKEFGNARVIDTPIAEASFTGAGVGAAIVGTRPVVEILFIDFTCLIMDQIINQAAKYKLMTGGEGKVPLVLRTQGGIGHGLAAQHSQSLEALFYHIPGLKIVMPFTPYDAKGLLKSAIRDDSPVIFIEHKLLYTMKGEVPEEEYVIPLGKGDIKRQGKDVTIVTYSYMTHTVLNACETLAQKGIEVEVIDLRTLAPLDKKIILTSVKKTGKLIIVHEACKKGGVGGDIAAMVMEEAFDYLDTPVIRVAGKNTPIPFNIKLEEASVPGEKEIIEAVEKICEG